MCAPPAQRAKNAGIPVVSVDRLTGYEKVDSRITGNFPANGAQAGMYLVWKLAQEGKLNAKMVMLRKPLGSTADSVRTGHFLKVLSYFPGIEVLRSYHDTDSREEAFTNAQAALQAFSEIDVESSADKRAEMQSRSGRRTVPQIFIGDHHVGGSDDLAALEAAGKLDALLSGTAR